MGAAVCNITVTLREFCYKGAEQAGESGPSAAWNPTALPREFPFIGENKKVPHSGTGLKPCSLCSRKGTGIPALCKAERTAAYIICLT